VWGEVWEWVGDNTWAAWLSLALLLAAAEVVSLDFVLLMLAVGAGAGAATAVLTNEIALQLLVAIVVSVALLGVVRPSMVKRMHGGAELTTGHAALVGRHGVVIDPVGKRGGLIRLAGEDWTARSFDPDLTIDAGAEVEVFEIDGATAVVYPAD
jgi:membrane protein implicated in regulation of membrane protease activity